MQKESVQTTERERRLSARVHELEDLTSQLEQRIAERERYHLVEDYPGTFTLRLKEASQDGEPMHHLCPGCLDNSKVKSILQFHDKEKRAADCPTCKQKYRFRDTVPMNLKVTGPY